MEESPPADQSNPGGAADTRQLQMVVRPPVFALFRSTIIHYHGPLLRVLQPPHQQSVLRLRVQVGQPTQIPRDALRQKGW